MNGYSLCTQGRFSHAKGHNYAALHTSVLRMATSQKLVVTKEFSNTKSLFIGT